MKINLYGVSTHNLKHIDLSVPKGKIVVFTGVSGSGKSSLVFDTIHAEGRFRYLETLSSEVGYFSRKRDRPTLMGINGLSPTVALEQKSGRKGSKSRLSDISHLSPLLRVLFTHLGSPHCPRGHGPINSHDVESVVRELSGMPSGTRLTISAPLSGPISQEMSNMLQRQGFTRILIGDERYDLSSPESPPAHDSFEVMVDRVILKDSSAPRIAGSVELAFRMASGRARVHVHEGQVI
ncbi:excinuclease ABC subunit UvrA, partial [Myxococcota bacterium]|nr:excinuclease ABC subunit UvrA [Myxococcota bacterium]